VRARPGAYCFRTDALFENLVSMTRASLISLLSLTLACSGAGAGENEKGATGVGGTGGAQSSGSGGTAKGGASASGSGGTGATPPTYDAGRGGGKAGAAQTGMSGTSSAGATSNAGSSEPGNHTNPLSQALIDQFVAAHNAARARTDLDPLPSPVLPPVSWDPILADAAYNYLSKCISTDGKLVDHNQNRTKDYAALGGTVYVGENIYASSGNTVMPRDAVDSWMSEKSAYVYGSGDLTKAGHYTQVVWRDSVQIGCAIVNCPSASYSDTILCDYAPGGNINGQNPY
jgi:pathogenesis-related protein 1